LIAVGEEDEVSIKELAEMIAEAMNFTGEIVVSLLQRVFDVCICIWMYGCICVIL